MSSSTAMRISAHRGGTRHDPRSRTGGAPHSPGVAPARTAQVAGPDNASHDDPDDPDDLEVFEELRPKLLNVAYRMLGSFTEAEDIVQEAWIRWAGRDRTTVESAQKYLVTVVSRLSIDRMRMAYRRRETYVGPHLPEPVAGDSALALGPESTAEQRETLSLGMLRVLQDLTAPERAVFVLREAFALPYDEIAGVLHLSVANARQLHRRGSKRLGEDRKRFDVDPNAHRQLVDRFAVAAQTGRRDVLQDLLATDVVMWTDGGGKVSVARRPVHGSDRVSRLLLGTFSKHVGPTVQIVELNGQPGLAITMSGALSVCTLETTDELITGIQWLANPDKLNHLRSCEQTRSL